MWNNVLRVWANSKKDTLNKKIAIYLLDKDKEVIGVSLTRAAEELGVAPSTITKFLYKVGFTGWKMYTSLALVNLNRKSAEIRDQLLGSKIEISAWIDLMYSGLIKNIAKKIIKSSEVVLFAHNTTKSILEMFRRNLSIVGIKIDIRDVSEKYAQYPTKRSSLTMLFSLTGSNFFLDSANNIMKSNKMLGYNVFISPSNKFFDDIDANINLKGSNINIDKLENIFPITKSHFVNHILDKIQMVVLADKQNEINGKHLNSKIWNK